MNYAPVTSRKSRHELTEAEKEERRLRRVLANRESAKRTVRRRQAMREELRRKAADLALENENLKKNKELAAAEYISLKNKNDHLRMQIAKIVKAEVEETYDDSKSTLMETPTSQTFLHNQVPLVLSTVFPHFDGLILQSDPQSVSGVTPQMPNTPLGGFKPYVRLESSVMMNTPGTPLCIVSFPCEMQFHAQSYSFHPYPNDQHMTSLVHECSTSTPKTTVNMENQLKPITPLKVETTTLDSTDTKPRDFFDDADRTSTSSPFVLPFNARQNEITQPHIYNPDVKVTCSAIGHVAGELAEMHQEHVTFSNNASAEARRKWKALMK